MPPPIIRRVPLTDAERLAAVEGELRELRKDLDEAMSREDVRDSRIKADVGETIAAAIRHVEAVVASMKTADEKRDEVLAEILKNSHAAAREREKRVAAEDAARDEEVKRIERKERNRQNLIRYSVVPIVLAIIAAFAGAAGVSHVTNGEHGTGHEKAAE